MDDKPQTVVPPESKSADLRGPSQRPTWVRWHMIVILMGFAGLNHFHRQSLPSVVGDVRCACGFSETDMGWVYFAFLLGYVLFMVAGGWLADWRGGKEALVVSGLGTAALVAATGGCGYLAGPGLAFGAMLLVRFSMGILTAPLFPAAGRIAHAWIPFGSRAWANGLVLGATTIGVAAAPIVFGGLSDLLNWQRACLFMGALTALLSGLWAVHGRNSPSEHRGVNDAEREWIGTPLEAAAPAAGD